MAKKKPFNIDEVLANEDIIDVNISDVVKQSTINYAMSVITDRALPDIRDGLTVLAPMLSDKHMQIF